MVILLSLFWSFAKVGIFGYGGGPSMIPLVEEEVVNVHHWMTIEEFTDALAMGNALPGPIAMKMSAYTGYKIAGIPGALTCMIGVTLPSCLAMLLLATFFLRFKDAPKVGSVLRAVRPAVVAMLAMVVYSMFPRSITSWHTGLIAVASVAAMMFLGVHPAWIVVATGVLGYLVY